MSSTSPHESSRLGTLASNSEDAAYDVLNVLRRQRWIVTLCVLVGLAVGIAYAFQAQPWYESQAKVLINSKTAGLSNSEPGSEMVEEDVLANHIELLRSRRIVEAALKQDGLTELPSFQPFIDETTDATDFVIDHLSLTKGGGGDAKAARSLEIAFTHADPVDSQRVLESILVEYQKFIVGQVESVMSSANRLVEKAKTDVEQGLRDAEREYMAARREAPLLFQGEGSSNVFQDKYRRLEDELLNLQIEEASVRTRYENVVAALKEMAESPDRAKLDQLALIDGKSLERLGIFAGLKMDASSTPEFLAAQPERIAEAQAQYSHLLELMSEKQRLSSVYGEQHPRVQDIDDEITLVKNFLSEKQEKLSSSIGMDELPLDPESLLRTYVGFLKNDLSAIEHRKRELDILSREAEKQAKTLIDYEIKDQILRNKITRQEELFDGVVQQLHALDTASGMSGYIYELLETPRFGVKVWPTLPLSALGGLLLGLLGGLALAVATDVRDQRFHSASQIEDSVGLPILGRVGKLPSVRRGVKGLLATEQSHDFEAFRMGRTLLLPDIRSGKLKTVGVTSAMQGDGKSMMAANFAVSVAQVGLKVLIIDADLRRPSQHRYFSVSETDGLKEIIEGTLDPQAAIRETELPNVSIIPAGAASTKPAELLQSTKFDSLLEDLSDQYDFIVVDLPPVLAVSDPLIVAPRVGGLMLVVKVASAKRDEVMNSVRRLKATGAKITGCLLNSFGSGKSFDHGGGFAGYYESSYSRPSAQANRNGTARAVKPAVVEEEKPAKKAKASSGV